MREHFPSEEPPSAQNLEISDNASLKNVQIGGIAGRDLYVNQIQGQSVSVTIYDRLLISDGLSSQYSYTSLWTVEELRYRKTLLNRVEDIWIKGVLEKSLYSQALSELGLKKEKSKVPFQVSGYQESTGESTRVFSKGTKIKDDFPNIGEGRTLLILGEPGSGKTTVLLKLLRSLIDQAKKDSHKLIPVVFNLSSWANKKRSIREWIIEELKEQYGISNSDLSKKWIKDQKLILLLDGLDEVQNPHRDAYVKALNQFTETHDITDIVVSCRIQEYRNLSEHLHLQSVIKIQPLTSEQIKKYLEQAGNNLAALATLLQQDNELQELASSPLILSIMSLTYQNYTLKELREIFLSKDFYSVLFNNYIEQMLKRRPIIAKRYAGICKQVVIFAFYLLVQPRKTYSHRYDTRLYRLGSLLLEEERYSRPQLINWLIWLAQQMSQKGQTIFFIEKMQPNFLKTKTQRLSYYFTVLLISGLLSSLSGLVHIPVQSIDNWKYALTTGLLEGFCVPLYYIWNFYWCKYWNKDNEEINLIEKLDWNLQERAKNLLKYVPISFLIGLIVAVPSAWLEIHGILNLYKEGIEKNIIGYQNSITLTMLILIYTCLVGIGLVFLYGLTSDSPTKEISNEIYPNQGIFITLQNTLFIGIIDWTITGVLSFLIGFYIQAHKMIPALTYGISYGFIAAVFFAICSSSGQTCIKHFALRLILYKKNLIPWNYAKFLDDASEMFFLRKVGIGYEFFHKEFQEYLANRPPI
ncbi:hypothetical protein NIES2109_61000 (plasmid) [Nostoc sp. HK-01]|nr:hypothetical protein NIES2109_61000 [Nostoc sp. HK-01]